MSHATGQVIHNGTIVGYFEYNGTSDFAFSRIFPDRDELWLYWRTEHIIGDDCDCDGPHEPVILYTNYADGFYWPATACLRCGVIVKGEDPWDGGHEPIDGHPLGEDHS